jgi:hypothetical protein
MQRRVRSLQYESKANMPRTSPWRATFAALILFGVVVICLIPSGGTQSAIRLFMITGAGSLVVGSVGLLFCWAGHVR